MSRQPKRPHQRESTVFKGTLSDADLVLYEIFSQLDKLRADLSRWENSVEPRERCKELLDFMRTHQSEDALLTQSSKPLPSINDPPTDLGYFPASTVVRLYDRSLKKICDLRCGDKLLALVLPEPKPSKDNTKENGIPSISTAKSLDSPLPTPARPRKRKARTPQPSTLRPRSRTTLNNSVPPLFPPSPKAYPATRMLHTAPPPPSSRARSQTHLITTIRENSTDDASNGALPVLRKSQTALASTENTTAQASPMSQEASSDPSRSFSFSVKQTFSRFSISSWMGGSQPEQTPNSTSNGNKHVYSNGTGRTQSDQRLEKKRHSEFYGKAKEQHTKDAFPKREHRKQNRKNGLTNRLKFKAIKVASSHETKVTKIVIVKTSIGSIRCLATQKFWLAGKGWGCVDPSSLKQLFKSKSKRGHNITSDEDDYSDLGSTDDDVDSSSDLDEKIDTNLIVQTRMQSGSSPLPPPKPSLRIKRESQKQQKRRTQLLKKRNKLHKIEKGSQLVTAAGKKVKVIDVSVKTLDKEILVFGVVVDTIGTFFVNDTLASTNTGTASIPLPPEIDKPAKVRIKERHARAQTVSVSPSYQVHRG